VPWGKGASARRRAETTNAGGKIPVAELSLKYFVTIINIERGVNKSVACPWLCGLDNGYLGAFELGGFLILSLLIPLVLSEKG